METKGITDNDTGERKFQLEDTSIKTWKYRFCPLRSSERWRRKQRVQNMHSLPDARHQLAKCLMRMLI